ncbi:hypothetical protein PG996_013691 [Apiospora saccharicola]|uniref:Uncharacterized protein n=1 Tax=Apiospora saccharicola TaxID=335842 RepID=A0ABR1U657_9PEZI
MDSQDQLSIWEARDAKSAVCIAKFDHRATVRPSAGVKWTGSFPCEVYNLSFHWIIPSAGQDLSTPGLVPLAVAKGEYQQDAEEAPPKTALGARIYDLAIDSTPILSSSHRTIKRFEPPPVSWPLVVENLATRNFSFSGDAHDALMGALNYFHEEHYMTFLWAIRRKEFALHLLWYGQGFCQRRDCLSTQYADW